MKTGNMNIVSGFISNINRRSDRDITKYLKFGLELMAVEIPMTVFIEREVFEKYIIRSLRIDCGVGGGRESSLSEEEEFVYRVHGGVMDGIQQKYSYMRIGHITFVFFRICDLFLWSYREMASKFKLNTGNPTKDTLEYMMVQCQKSEWMAIASQLCQKTRGDIGVGDVRGGLSIANEYVWIDFGIFHMFQGKIDVFQTELYKMRARIHRRLVQSPGLSRGIMFARCWDPSHVYQGDIYRDVNWLFAGSVFGGSADRIQQFALRVREKCLQVLREKNTLMWEINIWVLIYREFPELFAFYPSDHSEIIFRGYN